MYLLLTMLCLMLTAALIALFVVLFILLGDLAYDIVHIKKVYAKELVKFLFAVFIYFFMFSLTDILYSKIILRIPLEGTILPPHMNIIVGAILSIILLAFICEAWKKWRDEQTIRHVLCSTGAQHEEGQLPPN